jgi:phospholipid/cholesterol/gamma-HCH transport system permease protein
LFVFVIETAIKFMQFSISQWISDRLQRLGDVSLFVVDTIRAIFSKRMEWSAAVYQLYFLGFKSQSVVLVTGAFTGMVLCAQTYFQFHKVKMDTATGAVVSVAMCSELGPVLTALMVAGRVGSAMAAELGAMKVSEQIDALRTLATHPLDYLVAPRFAATAVALPMLTIEAIVIGIISSYIVGSQLLGIDPVYYYHNLVRYTAPSHVMEGIIKSIFFGAIIAIVGCYRGMHCREGAQGVGRATTEAVVTASIVILISNFFLTLALSKLLHPEL